MITSPLNTPLKILIHGLNYAPEQVGIGKYTGELAEYLVKSGADVTVVTTPPYYPSWKIGDGYHGGRYRFEKMNGVSVIRCPLWVPRRLSGLKRIVHLASFGLSSLPAVLRRAFDKPDVVFVVEPTLWCLPGAWLTARLCGAKTWLHVQDLEVDAAFELGLLRSKWIKKSILAIEAFLMRRFDRVSSITPAMLERLRDKGISADRLQLLPNWVDCRAIYPLPDRSALKSKFDLAPHKFVALYAGNFGAKQGLEIVIDAARMLEHRDDFQLVLCGNGAAMETLKRYADGIKNIVWLPVQPMDRLNELLNSADLHLLPQRADVADLVMPSKLTGMLASGRPVLATAHANTQIAKVLQTRGVVVEPGDNLGFVAAIESLIADSTYCEKIGCEARAFAVSELDMPPIIDRFRDELNVLCTPGKGIA